MKLEGSDDEKELKITEGPLKGKRVIIAPREKVESLQYELEEILEIIGHPEALITDCSSISDFLSGDDDSAVKEFMLRISDALTIDVDDPNELLVDLAMRARKARKG